MKLINLTLYTFDELSEDVQKRIIDEERWNIMERCMDGYSPEYRQSLKKFEKLFNVKCDNWRVDYCNYYFSFVLDKFEAFEWNKGSIELESLSGKLLQRYLRNRILPYIEEGKLYMKTIGIYPNSRYSKRHSKIKKVIDCPFTGAIYDMFLLDPLLKYLSSPNEHTTYEELMNECLEMFFQAWHEEYEYWADDEDAILEQLHNEYGDRMYYKDGRTYVGTMEDVA